MDLEVKAQNEKYYKSIRYLSHSLNGESRRNFIILISEYNTYLAAQCAMTCEKDNELEELLALKAINDSKSDIQTKKLFGILGLIELNRYDIISEVFNNLNSNMKMYRYVIRQVINEIDTDNIIKFLKALVNTNTRWLISSVITAIYSREIGISNEQYKEAELIYEKLQCIYNHGDFRLLRFFIAFNLPKRLLPHNLDIVAKKNIRKCRIELIEELYRKYEIEYTFSKYDLCNILLGRNKQSSVLAFSKAFFEINELDKQLYLLRNAILKRKYFSAFCLSLLKDKTKREYYANKFDNPKDILIFN